MHSCDSFSSGKNSNNYFDLNITIKEEISDIFLPINDEGRSQIILIEGAPGIGKTMLMIQIGTLWAEGKKLDNKKLVLLLPLRELDIDKINSIEDIFDHICHGKENARICGEYFKNNNGEGLMILLDGLDENLQAMKKDSFLYKILIRDNVFSKACIVITSRPHATVELQKLVSYRVEIIGFTNEKRRQFVRDNLKENAKDLEDYLQKHHIINTLCYIPLNMSILVFLFHEKNRLKGDYLLPDTQTELLRQAIKMTVLHNLEDKLNISGLQEDLKSLPEPYKKIFKYLCALAYDALNKNKSVFDERYIEKACPVKGDETITAAVTNGLGLLQTARFFADISGKTDTFSNFAHFSIQEFLAAWYFTFDYRCIFPLPLAIGCRYLRTSSQVKVLKDKFWNGDYMNMWSFYVGLTRGEDLAFKYFLSKTNMPSCCMHGSKDFSISKGILDNKIKALHLYFFLQEAPPDNTIIVRLKLIVTPQHIDISGQTVKLEKKKADLELLGYILSRPYLTDQWDKVILSSCEIDDDSFEVLHNILIRNDKSPKIKALSLHNNELNSCSDVIANLVSSQKIRCLDLSNNQLEGFNPFQKCAGCLVTLKISNNGLDDKKALDLFETLKYFKNLKILSLNNNNINTDQKLIDALGLALCCCNSLEELEICGNMIEDEALLLFEVINDIRSSKTNVHYYRLSDKAFAFLKILRYCDQTDYKLELHALRSKIIESIGVNISWNGLPGDAGCLGQHLHLLTNLKILNITKNKVSDEATKSLTIGMLLTPKLEEFKCEENLFSENSILIFKTIHILRTTDSKMLECKPSEVKPLLFILDCINDNADKLQSSDIVSAIKYITELNLSNNELTDGDCKKFCKVLTWFKQLNILDLTNNDISNEVKESLTKAMLQISALNTVRLIGNPIIVDEFSMSVFDTIKNLREEKIRSIVDNQKSSSHILSQSVIYIMKCLNELDNPDCFKSFNNIITLDIDSELSYAGNCFYYIKFLPFLKHLKIINVKNISDIGVNQLGEFLSQNRILTTLDLSSCNLEKLNVKSAPSGRIPLKVLKLNRSNITHEVLLNLSCNVLMFANLDELDLGSNLFGDNGISNLHSVLISCKNDQLSPTVTALNLANNQLTMSSAVKIVEIVEKCNVKYLDISDNYLESIFCQFKNITITTLEELNISANNHFKDNVVQFATNLSYLKSCSSLKKLDISNNSIDETANYELHYFFAECYYLEEVKCDENPEIELAFYFVKNLQNSSNKSILQCPPSKIKTVVHLLRSIQDNDQKLPSNCFVYRMSIVTELNLSHSEPTTLEYKLTSQDFKELCEVLTCLKHLKVLDVRNNDISNEISESLTKVMLQISALNTVKLIGNPIIEDEFSMSVFGTIKILREEQIQSIVDDQKSSSHSIIYIMQCLNELENPDCFKSFDNIITVDIDSESNYAGKFFECIKFLPSLKSLKINNVKNITDIGINQLGEYLCQNRTLTTLDLSSCDLEKLDVKCAPRERIPLKVLKLNHSNITQEVLLNLSLNVLMFADLDELDLGGNVFDDNGIGKLHNVLISCKSDQLGMTATRLNLSNNKLTSCSAGKIVEIVVKCQVKYINISNNNLGGVFCNSENFIYSLQNCTEIQELNLKNNNITDKTFKYLATAFLFTSNLKLSHLNLEGNPCERDLNVSILKMIEKLRLVNNNYFACPPKQFEIFLTIFELVHSVENKPNDIAKSISDITTLNISYSDLSNSFDKQIKYTRKLQSDDIKSICNYLKYFKSLKSIDMRGNDIKKDVQDDLVITVLKNHNITEIYLEQNPIHEVVKCQKLFETIQKLRKCENKCSFEDVPQTLEALVNILKYVNDSTDQTCDITNKIEELDISSFCKPQHRKRRYGIETVNNPEEISAGLIRHLKLFRKLKKLNMHDACLTSDSLDELSRFLSSNNTLQYLDISSNDIQAEGALVILQSLNTNTTLKKLNLRNNKITGPGRKHKEVTRIIGMLSIEVDMSGNEPTRRK